MLDDDVRLVSIVHAPSHNGLVNDIAAVGQTLAGSRAWFLVDACQSFGQLPIDMAGVNCDFLIASGRKFLRGPGAAGCWRSATGPSPNWMPIPSICTAPPGPAATASPWRTPPDASESFERSVAVELGLIAAARYAGELSVPVLASAIGRHAEYLRCRVGAMRDWRVLDREPNAPASSRSSTAA